MRTHCLVCGHATFGFNPILWDELIREWQLAPFEVDYINHQQAEICLACGNNLRANAIAQAIMASFGFSGVLTEFCRAADYQSIQVLEINRAVYLTEVLSVLPKHQLVEYPDVDMTRMNFQDESFDLVIHSDTLEHVANPVAGLIECRRVLRTGGWCVFTVPVVVDRWSRSRQGLSPSYHGAPGTDASDLLVHTEFGADIWKLVLQAGFSNVTIHALDYPAALAIAARK